MTNYIFNPQFNFSLATLNKLNDEMKDSNQALRNKENVLDYFTRIEIFYKSTYPFLDKKMKGLSGSAWNSIKAFDIELGEDFIEYDSDMLDQLKDFDFFLNECLHNLGISYSKKEGNKGLANQYKKYGLDSKPKGTSDTD